MTNGYKETNDIILVISRIAPHKKIENAIKLAKILKDNNIGKGMKIVGNLYYYFFDYYSELKQMVLDLGLTDYVTFEINARLDKLISIIARIQSIFSSNGRRTFWDGSIRSHGCWTNSSSSK